MRDINDILQIMTPGFVLMSPLKNNEQYCAGSLRYLAIPYLWIYTLKSQSLYQMAFAYGVIAKAALFFLKKTYRKKI